MYPSWIFRPLLCFVLLAQLPGASAELLVSVAEAEWFWSFVHLAAVVGDIFFCYKILRDGIE